MHPPLKWYQTLAWTFFIRQAATILVLVALVLWVAFLEAERGARATANASLSAGGYVLERAFEQQGRSLDAGLEVFSQYSGNLALIEHAIETGKTTTLVDAMAENLPRLNAEIALVLGPSGQTLASTDREARANLPEVGILQMALEPEAALAAGHPGPFYRGFLRVEGGERPGVYHAVARPLRSPGGRPLGAMLVGIRVDDRLAMDLRRVAIAGPQRGDPSAHLALLSRFRVLGSTLRESDGLERLLVRDPAFLSQRGPVLDSHRSQVLSFPVEGRPYLGMISPLRGVNAFDLETAHLLMMPVDPLLAPFRRLQKGILGVGGAGLILALGLSLWSARKVTAPLHALASAAEGLAAGEAPESLAIEAAQGEVGMLTRAFKAMVVELNAREQLLKLLEATRLGKGPDAPHTGDLAEEVVDPAPSFDPTQDGTQPIQVAAPVQADPTFPAVLEEGRMFAGRYRVEGLLGRGGMGVVVKVRDMHLDEEVALKVVRDSLASDPAFIELLKREIRLARKITHRYVLRTHDFGECDGLPYVTMEYLKGVTLRSLLDSRGRLPMALVLRITRQVAEGLEAAHAVGVVHRDIKPANVLFDVRGDAKVMDFGLAAPEAALLASEAGSLVGSPRYMSPEQIRGERVDARADLYALGVMLYELCTGAPPFDCVRINDLLAMHLDAPPPSLKGTLPDVSADLAALVHRLLQKRPEDRPQSATEVAEILKILASGGGTSRL